MERRGSPEKGGKRRDRVAVRRRSAAAREERRDLLEERRDRVRELSSGIGLDQWASALVRVLQRVLGYFVFFFIKWLMIFF